MAKADLLSAPSPGKTAASSPWLSIIGIGEDGTDGLSPTARELVGRAEIVFGGKRHLALAAPLICGAARPWPSPFDGALSEVLRHRGQPVCVLASGDPYHYGIGALLARHVDRREIRAVPAPSAFSLAAAKLGWALADTVQLSLHGRALDLVRPHLHPGTRALALMSDGHAPGTLARLLAQTGFGASRLTVLEAIGGPRERVRSSSAAGFALDGIDDLNLVAIEVAAQPQARIIARAPGRSDGLFEHDGQITKREVRAIALSSLAPRRGELLWDIGAGAGSIAIEWMLADVSLRAIAIERMAERAERIKRNAAALGVPGLVVIEGIAPAALDDLSNPDAIFIGGGASDPGLLDHCVAALCSGGRLVVNAVTLETESLLLERRANLGGDLVRIAVAHAAALGSKTGWRPAMPVTQWAWVKP